MNSNVSILKKYSYAFLRGDENVFRAWIHRVDFLILTKVDRINVEKENLTNSASNIARCWPSIRISWTRPLFLSATCKLPLAVLMMSCGRLNWSSLLPRSPKLLLSSSFLKLISLVGVEFLCLFRSKILAL